ncbi:MAG: hypothetical protein PCFJNLEI_03619 [Verrucomicrobiae bacterium]|nr:hypothetical protein [Verrucomicrobiae bacterium]
MHNGRFILTAQIRVALFIGVFGFCASVAFAEGVKHTITTTDTKIELWVPKNSEGFTCDAKSLTSSTEAGVQRTTATGGVHISYREGGKLLLDVRSERATIETTTEKK